MDENKKHGVKFVITDGTLYEGDGKLIPFPAPEKGPNPIEHVDAKTLQEMNPDEQKELIDDPDEPLNEVNEHQIRQMIQMAKEMTQVMEASWTATQQEFKLTDTHMKGLYQYNETHKKTMPDYITDEEREKWDHFNGLDNITEEEVIEIFGEDSPVIGITHDVTKDRIKSFMEDYFNWLSALREYKDIHKAYIKLIEAQEEKNLEELQKVADAETDPVKKKGYQDAIDLYFNRKYLKFLAEPLEEQDRNRIVHAFNTEKTISYWLKRSQDKLGQLKMPSKFILEISQFEKRYLPEKYHKQSNILLLYFMMTIIYCSCSDKRDPGRNKSIAMIMTLDQLVQDVLEPDKKEIVMNNIMAFEDQFMDLIPERPQTDSAE